ncbi:MAG: lipopolysaccharide kinase InaA family protein [Planctomycetota bacterium]
MQVADPALKASGLGTRSRWFFRLGWAGAWKPGRWESGIEGVVLVLSGHRSAEPLNQRSNSVTFRVPTEQFGDADAQRDSFYVKHTRETLLRGVLRLEWPQAWRVARLEALMLRAGLAVPKVWLAASRVGREGVEHVVVLEGVPGRSLLDVRQQAGRGADYDRAIREAALAAAKLHGAGFVHGDMVPGNLMLAKGGPGDKQRIVFIDNDRTRRVYGPWRWRARLRNTAQLTYRLRLLGRWADARTFLRVYAEACGLPPSQIRWIRGASIRRSRVGFPRGKAQRLRAEMDGSPA